MDLGFRVLAHGAHSEPINQVLKFKVGVWGSGLRLSFKVGVEVMELAGIKFEGCGYQV